jgi:hypothetical protein
MPVNCCSKIVGIMPLTNQANSQVESDRRDRPFVELLNLQTGDAVRFVAGDDGLICIPAGEYGPIQGFPLPEKAPSR